MNAKAAEKAAVYLLAINQGCMPRHVEDVVPGGEGGDTL